MEKYKSGELQRTRVLVVDDNPSIHKDFKKILGSQKNKESGIEGVEKLLFGEESHSRARQKTSYELVDAASGEEAVALVEDSKAKKAPFSVAFVDQRMTGGIDGIATIKKMWEIDPFIQVVLCTAYSEYTWEEIVERLGKTDKLLILKKPFDWIEISQFSMALTSKWNLEARSRKYEKELRDMVIEQTSTISSMFEFANRLGAMDSLDDILDCTLDTIAFFTGSLRISIMLADENGKYLSIARSRGLPEGIADTTRLATGEGIAGKVFATGNVLIVNDMSQEGFQKTYSPSDAFMSVPFISAPLLGPRERLGVINVTDKDGNLPFTSSDASIMTYIAYTASIAISNQLNATRLEDMFVGTIKSLAQAIEAKDPYTRGHSERVSSLSLGIAKEMGLSPAEQKVIQYAGILHDIGKIGIKEDILQKITPLTKEEYETIKRHPVIGADILAEIKPLERERKIIRHHHERIDGSGYPDGLAEDAIPPGSKILAVADTFDAMNSDRPYRIRISEDEIIEELKCQAGKTLDKECVEALIRHIRHSGKKRKDGKK